MKVLWIFAHPERRSLNASLRDAGIRALDELGHEHRESDLYAMNWNPVVDRADFGLDPAARLLVGPDSEQAYLCGELSDDIRAEQEKIKWADTVVLQFPLWWAGPPAILKGWFDRVFVKGFAFGVSGDDGRTLRYGEGKLAGRRAMAVVSVGAREASLGPRGVNGDIGELLFPLHHGTLWYAGISAVPPLVVYGADRATGTEYVEYSTELTTRLASLDTTPPIPFRYQNHGDYDENLELKPDRAPGRAGLGVHLAP
ncbi:MAG TPA: NAD(P)H-dependent oxidoreductase [Amycolatopsis sp.]|nr:NAD(P)H-dependent oxidoreductase [Amycolatopsis sp.]